MIRKLHYFTFGELPIGFRQWVVHLTDSYNITRQTMNNYMRMANMIQEIEN